MYRTFLAAALVLGLAGTASPSYAATIGPPMPESSTFGTGAVNRYFPLVPGTTTSFAGAIDGVRAKETFAVTSKIKIIQGVPANVIRDSLYLQRDRGRGWYLAELTTDWYATAADGDVWYLGEATAEYDAQGKLVSTDGSWQAGVSGARAGIYMPADPRVGQVLQQEMASDAQDLFRITAVDDDGLTTREWTPLEPGLVTKKIYEAGVGMVLEDTVKGAAIEDLRLALVHRQP
jgi:hypothetical protein